MNVFSVPVDQTMNHTIYNAMAASCIEAVELSSVGEALDQKRAELLNAIEGKIPSETHGKLSDLFMTYACEYGEEMFKLGLAIGRNPDLIFNLPDGGAA